jgi:hypothetical protein
MLNVQAAAEKVARYRHRSSQPCYPMAKVDNSTVEELLAKIKA